VLYVNPAHHAIAGMPQEESQPILELLFRHATRSEFIYPTSGACNDMIFWDNRCTCTTRSRITISRCGAHAPHDHRGDAPYEAALHRASTIVDAPSRSGLMGRIGCSAAGMRFLCRRCCGCS